MRSVKNEELHLMPVIKRISSPPNNNGKGLLTSPQINKKTTALEQDYSYPSRNADKSFQSLQKNSWRKKLTKKETTKFRPSNIENAMFETILLKVIIHN